MQTDEKCASARPKRMRTRGKFAAIATLGVFSVLAPVAAAVSPVAAAEPDTTFTLAVVPDTQNEVLTDNPLMADRYRWIADHAKSDDIRFTVHTGDVVNWGVADPAQFVRADAATRILDEARMPYAYAVGNHDGAAVTVGGSAAPGDVRANLRNTSLFNKTFPLARFANVEGVFEAGKVDNMFQTFSAGGKDWLVLTLELWPRTDAINWAKNVVASHPHHNVIINTHINIDGTGQRRTAGVYGDNNAQVLWDRLGSQYPNITMILSGHYESKGPGDPGTYANTVTGVHGNKVLQVMSAYTSPTQNHLRLLKVDTAAMTVTSSVFVNLSLNKALPAGPVNDASANIAATGMRFVDPAVTVPSAPTTVTATPGDQAAEVAFTPGAAGGSPATSYTVTANPGNISAEASSSPITVTGLTNGTAYTFTVTATNSAGKSPASIASKAVTPAAAPTPQLLADPGFENGDSGWSPFATGDMRRVTNPVRSGTSAMRITATSTGAALVGMTQNTVVGKSVAGHTYTARCYVRPSAPGLEVRIRLVEYLQDWSKNTKLGTTIVTTLPVDQWTPVTVTATATASGDRIIPQIYASFQTATTGFLYYDDCSLT